MLGKNEFSTKNFSQRINEKISKYLIHLSRKEGKKSAVEQRHQYATRRRLGRTSSCGILLNTRFDIDPSFPHRPSRHISKSVLLLFFISIDI